MKYQDTFKRYEIKYGINKKQYQVIKQAVAQYLAADPYGNSTVKNVYYDTPDRLLIRNSINKPVYKEKLRIRGYGSVDSKTIVHIELKKKYQGIVYKRRLSLPEASVGRQLSGDRVLICNHQIAKEINYFWNYYNRLEPAIYLAYDREAYFDPREAGFRITFDHNILYREQEMTLTSTNYGQALLSQDQILMEVKMARAMPLWLAKLLSQLQIYKTSFSKYGEAYRCIQEKKQIGGHYVA